MVGASIYAALEKLEGSTVRIRDEGLSELRRFLSVSASSSHVKSLADDQWHNILDTLFKLIKTDLHSARHGSDTARKRAVERLKNLLEAFKLVVEACTPLIKHKTAYLVLDRIQQTAPHEPDEVSHHVCNVYYGAFKAVLSHPTHGEHLRPERWISYVDFVLEAIRAYLQWDENSINGSSYGQSAVSTARGTPMLISQQSSGGQSVGVRDDLLATLKDMSSITNSPLRARMREIASTLCNVLGAQSRSPELVFEVLAKILHVCRTEDIAFSEWLVFTIIPHARTYWTTRFDPQSMELRDQILICLHRARHMLRLESIHDDQRRETVQKLEARLSDDWHNRSDILPLSDVLLTTIVADREPFALSGLIPNVQSRLTMQDWSLASIVGYLKARLAVGGDKTHNAPTMQPPYKRQKTSAVLVDMLRPATMSDSSLAVTSLQLAFFMVNHLSELTDGVIEILLQLIAVAGDELSPRSSWVLLFFARLATSRFCKTEQLQGVWTHAWTAAGRLITSPKHSRSACFLLYTLLHSDLTRTQLSNTSLTEICFPHGIRGPAQLSDASLLLFASATRSGLLGSEKLLKSYVEKVLNWLEGIWSIKSTVERTHNQLLVRMARPTLVHDLFLAILGDSSATEDLQSSLMVSKLYLASCEDAADSCLIDLVYGTTDSSHSVNEHQASPTRLSVGADRQSFQDSTRRLLQTKMDDFMDQIRGAEESQAPRWSLDTLTATAVVIAVTASLSGIAALHETSERVSKEWDAVVAWASQSQEDEFQSVFIKLGRVLLQVTSPGNTRQESCLALKHQLLSRLLRSAEHVDRHQAPLNEFDAEFVESTRLLNSQASQMRSQKLDQYSDRRMLPIHCNQPSTFEEIRAHLCWQALSSKEGTALTRCAGLVEYLAAKAVPDIMVTGNVLISLIDDVGMAEVPDACRLLRSLAKTCLQHDDLERNEVALLLCLHAMIALSDTWLSDRTDELSDVAFDIYNWYVSVALERSIASSTVLYSLSRLLNIIIRQNPDYGTQEGLAPARTSLLRILQIGPMSLKIKLVPFLVNIFEGIALTEHAAAFDSIVNTLPTDPDAQAGIAVRVYVLAVLGSRWRTVLRQAIYHIFETAASAAMSMNAIQRALELVCKKIKVATSQELLHMFVPQILYTWLETNSLDTIPFSAFGYSTMKDFLVTEQEELVAHLVVRQNRHHIDFLESVSQESFASQLELAFPRAQVYAMATDVAIHRSGAQEGSCERFLMDSIGDRNYADSSRHRLAEAVAWIFLSLSDDRGFDKLLSSTDRTALNLGIYDKIIKKSSSKLEHPPSQQPSFRAKYLLQVLAKAAHCAGMELETIWTQPLLVYVCRRILDDAKSAQGTLHVAMAIKKIRMITVLAGGAMLRNSALEVVLRNVGLHLTSHRCVDDCIGIIWYLLEEGSDYLATRISFLTEFSVQLFHSLASVTLSIKESTTRSPDHTLTLLKVEKFWNWVGGYFEGLDRLTGTEGQRALFQQIVRLMKDIGVVALSAKPSARASVLIRLIQDQASEGPLLRWNAFRFLLLLLTSDFQLSDDFSSSRFDDDQDIVRCVPVLVKTSRLATLSAGFRAWLGGQLGRALLQVGPELRMVHDRISRSSADRVGLEPLDSCRDILHELADIAAGGDSGRAGQAERTISLLLSTMSIEDRDPLLSPDPHLHDLTDLVFVADECPGLYVHAPQRTDFFETGTVTSQDYDTWLTDLAVALVTFVNYDPFLVGLGPILHSAPEFIERILPQLVHLALFAEAERTSRLRRDLSSFFSQALRVTGPISQKVGILVLSVVVYLRSCTMPAESTMAKRNSWLIVDWETAANAALSCDQPETALLMMEIRASEKALQVTKPSRRSALQGDVDKVFLNHIFVNVSDHDFFYGDYKESDLTSILLKLQHEDQGEKVLSFQSALLDASSKTRGLDDAIQSQSTGIITALNLANLDSLACVTQQYTSDRSSTAASTGASDPFLNVHQWDLIASDKDVQEQSILQSILQKLSRMTSREALLNEIKHSYQSTISAIVSKAQYVSTARQHLPLATLAQIDDIVRLEGNTVLEDLSRVAARDPSWSSTTSFDFLSPILLAREATLAAIRANRAPPISMDISKPQALLLEIQAVRQSLSIALVHDERQFSLNRAAYLVELSRLAGVSGLHVKAVTNYDLARTLWAQGEVTAPIEILRNLHKSQYTEKQEIEVSESELLTELGQKLSEARLDRPDEVTTHYLQPAIKALGKCSTGSQAGKVFHNYAAFCDRQLQDSTGIDDYNRAERIYSRKKQEVSELADMVRKAEGKIKDVMKMHYSKAKTWLKLDEEDFLRQKSNRDALLYSSLENYLLSLQACDDFSNDILRLLSLWLSSSTDHAANAIVQPHLALVPTVKFAPFINQLMSRLLDDKEIFQSLLFNLLYRICCDHPHHSLYQLFATWKTKGSSQDEVARSRHKAAGELAKTVQGCKKPSAHIWIAVHNSSITTVYFANEKTDKDVKTGTKVPLHKFQHGKKLEQDFANLATKIPPPTMRIALKQDRDYSMLPTLDHFDASISIAGGVSAPKIVTVVASDSSRHKMLLKGGNDDLRQDAIMEQVFEQVSNLLKEYRSTRERKLGIRTYKVIPLTQNAGVIEFVQNTIPLHDFLLPAHQRYFPRDYKPNQCRRAIADVQTKSLATRLQAFNTVAANFHPVGRFFFMEYFLDPHEWFQKRLAYSRSTAAISMLGHVLGLGDRHGHNILLDTQSGEVVHIDLGVAFESGRVLPVPEVVPFRLTRDLVDGMGLSGVEGPFRRCCNFTLEALRKNQDAILTILDVLRYDPLYSWSVSPLRLQRMQEAQEREAAAATASSVSSNTSDIKTAATTAAAQKAKHSADKTLMANEPSEADRALAIVAKKLSKSLSVEATVNQLIRQAMDERNLAVLYCGWAAYA